MNKNEKPKRSIVLTGAPTTGKTTIHRELLKGGFETVPDETTRPIRLGEIDGVDKIFLKTEEFIRRFDLGWYLEPNVEFTIFNGNHYGTPRSWLDFAKNPERRMAVITVSTEIARIVKIHLGEDVAWVHLKADEETRRNRLLARGISNEEVEYRLKNGDSILEIGDSDLLIDTADFSMNECLEIIKRHVYEQ